MAIGRIPEPGTGIPESIVDAKGDIVTATAADTPARLAVGTNNQTLVAASGEATGLKYANGSVSTLTAKGDLLTATAANTISRLAVGSDGTTLVADSSEATGLKWASASAGGMTLLSTTTLSGATTTISSISSAYVNLFMVIYGVTNATGDGYFRIAPNASSTITNTWGWSDFGSVNAANDGYIFPAQYGAVRTVVRTNANNAWSLTLENYASTASFKPYQSTGVFINSIGGDITGAAFGVVKTTSAISSLVFSNSGGNLSTGTVLLYGVK